MRGQIMRGFGLIIATFGFGCVIANLILGCHWIVPYLIWGLVGVIGVIIVVVNPKPQKSQLDGWIALLFGVKNNTAKNTLLPEDSNDNSKETLNLK